MARSIKSIKAVSGKTYNLCYRQMLPVLVLKLLKQSLAFNEKERRKQMVVHCSKHCVVYHKVNAILKLPGNVCKASFD